MSRNTDKQRGSSIGWADRSDPAGIMSTKRKPGIEWLHSTPGLRQAFQAAGYFDAYRLLTLPHVVFATGNVTRVIRTA